MLALLDPSTGPILTHGAVEITNDILREQGLPLPATRRVTADMTPPAGALVLAPPAALAGKWARRFGRAALAHASGWMQLRGVRRRRGAAQGFVISDHADWDGLNAAIRATGAESIYTTHGYTDIFTRWLAHGGYDAHHVRTEFGTSDAPAEPLE